MKRHLIFTVVLSTYLFSCVSSKKYQALQSYYDQQTEKVTQLQRDNDNCNSAKAELERQNQLKVSENRSLNDHVSDLSKQVEFMKANNTTVLQELQNLSVVSGTQAESIKKSLENIGAKDSYIQNLQTALAHKDSLNLMLVMNLKGAIGNLQDEDINIKIDKDVVYIDISDKLLFKSGKYEVTAQAKQVLGKVAMVLKNQPDIEFMVEGHTDNVPFSSGVLLDNWDLSVKRATSVVRILQDQYGLDPAKMAASGRGEFNPIVDNSTPENRATNRRTRIVILPQLDQFFKLLEPKK